MEKQRDIKIPKVDFKKQPKIVQILILIVGGFIGLTIIKKMIPSYMFSIIIGVIIAIGLFWGYYELIRPIINKNIVTHK